MKFLSVNVNKKLGGAASASAFHAKLEERNPDVILIQEPVARRQQVPNTLRHYGLVSGHDGITVYASNASVAPIGHSEFYVECALGDIRLFNVYLDANSSRLRRTQVEQLGGRLRALEGRSVLLAGDFNTAIRPQDGMYGDVPSKTWTTKSERAVLENFLREHNLVDVLADDVAGQPTYTIERTSNGKPSCFRCDLLLASSALMSGLSAMYDHTWRTPHPTFTDHSAIWFELN